jgi:uncharacterized protein YqjF (DUF2071 family)
MFQGWKQLSFFHWPCRPALLQSRLPPGLRVDAFEGDAWLGLTPFLLTDLRFPFLPAIPRLSTFPEMNLRTYVIGPAGPGIWFFSLDAARLLAVLGARMTLGLPYYWADMRIDLESGAVSYFSRRRAAHARIRVKVGEPIPSQSSLERFLTARFRLYSTHGSRLLTAEVDHEPWPLSRAVVLEFEETVRRAAGLEECRGEMLVHYSPGVVSRIGRPRLVGIESR